MKFIISDFVDKVTGFFIFIIQYEVVNFLKYLIKILDYFQKYLIILKIEENMGFPYIVMYMRWTVRPTPHSKTFSQENKKHRSKIKLKKLLKTSYFKSSNQQFRWL